MCDQDKIVAATVRCFHTPGSPAVALLESLLAEDMEELMRQCLVILQTANTLLDEEGKQLTDIFQNQGTPLVCSLGCEGCCHQLVLCQPFEAKNIHVFLEEHPEKMQDFQAAYRLWNAATASLQQSYVAWAVNYYSQGEDSGSHVFEDYQAACPFLDREGLCSIYPVRPYGCRTCIALDPVCALPSTGKKEMLHIQYSMYTTHHAARMALTRMLLHRLGAETTPIPMPTMLAALCRI